MRKSAIVFVNIIVLISPASLAAQSITAFKTGELASGMTKQCIYDGLGSTYTRTVSSIAICPLSIQVSTQPQAQQNQQSQERTGSSGSITAFKSGEITTGMTKQCFYNGLGNTYTRTMSSIALCPLSIQVGR
jgi:hypothetical protein